MVEVDLTAAQAAEIQSQRHEYTLIGKATINADFTFRNPNEQLCQYLGVTKADLIGKRFGDITSSPLREITESNGRMMIEGRIPCFMLPNPYRVSHDSRTVHVMLSVLPVLKENGDFDCFDAEILKIPEETYKAELKRLLANHPSLQPTHPFRLSGSLLSMITWSKRDWKQSILVVCGGIISLAELLKVIKDQWEKILLHF